SGGEDRDENASFHTGDLVWGPAKGFAAWPGKIASVDGDRVATVMWFGGERCASRIEVGALQTLAQGLDAHHQARQRARTSRKLNSQLESAIQEAMSELDKNPDAQKNNLEEKNLKAAACAKKNGGRLRSQR
ncbi:unnamed protein product, partial [Brassicogethes aeneus]